MLDLKLTDNDFMINAERTLESVSDSRVVIQKILILLSLQRGMYFYDAERGITWVEFIENSTPSGEIVVYLIRYLYEIEGVGKVPLLLVNFNENRNAIVTGRVEDIYGNSFNFEGGNHVKSNR
jgi:hypothetical protein